jgi:hypothetical protein
MAKETQRDLDSKRIAQEIDKLDAEIPEIESNLSYAKNKREQSVRQLRNLILGKEY